MQAPLSGAATQPFMKPTSHAGVEAERGQPHLPGPLGSGHREQASAKRLTPTLASPALPSLVCSFTVLGGHREPENRPRAQLRSGHLGSNANSALPSLRDPGKPLALPRLGFLIYRVETAVRTKRATRSKETRIKRRVRCWVNSSCWKNNCEHLRSTRPTPGPGPGTHLCWGSCSPGPQGAQRVVRESILSTGCRVMGPRWRGEPKGSWRSPPGDRGG